MTQIEAEIVMDMLYTCDDSPHVEVREIVGISVRVHKPTPDPENSVYGSCEKAAPAGEEGFRAARAEGEGFRKRLCRARGMGIVGMGIVTV